MAGTTNAECPAQVSSRPVPTTQTRVRARVMLARYRDRDSGNSGITLVLSLAVRRVLGVSSMSLHVLALFDRLLVSFYV